MKKIILILILILCSCGAPTWFTISNRPMQECAYNNIDSVCVVDSLPTDLSEWQQVGFKDYENKERFSKYILIKDSITYIRTDSNIVKRW